ncbi:MAG: hypothetical protein OEO23_15475, partial [Gemmatimonadota bacterium]|nr:hypothetical protein [Gemmatimonadota bacterium]
MSIESLKEKARTHEQREEWKAALDTYVQAIQKLDDDDQTDIGLYNRVGDIAIRLGQIDRAADHYMQSVDLYAEAELPNNAIAVCKKIIRNIPTRTDVYLRMGQIRASQGFLTDARESFLAYAERTQQEGDLEEAFRALIEFADLAPDDTDVRMALATQLHAHERTSEAVEQLIEARSTLILGGRDEEVAEVEGLIAEYAPDTELPDADAVRSVVEAEVAHAAFEPDSLALEGVEAAFGGEGTAQGEDASPGAAVEGLEPTGLASGDEPADPVDSDEAPGAEDVAPDMAASVAEAFGSDVAAEAADDESVESSGSELAAVAEAVEEEVEDADGIDGLAELAELADAFEALDDEDGPVFEGTDAADASSDDHDILDDWATEAEEDGRTAGAGEDEEDGGDLPLISLGVEDETSTTSPSMGDDWLTELTVDSRDPGPSRDAVGSGSAGESLPGSAIDVVTAPDQAEETGFEDDLFDGG